MADKSTGNTPAPAPTSKPVVVPPKHSVVERSNDQSKVTRKG